MFGGFALETCEQRLSRDGRTVPLSPKALQVLLTLVRNAGQLVTKKRMLEAVWPDSFVEEGILAVHISNIRKALRESGDVRGLIQTVPRRGYRFHGPVSLAEDPNAGARSSSITGVRRPEVYELFGRGRSHLLSASMTEMPKAVQAFQEAIALDADYAEANAGLALAHCAQAEFRLTSCAEAYNQARTAALRALALDGSCADAQVALGAVLFFSDWNWTGAERSLRRALDLNPSHTEAYLLLGRLLEAVIRLDEGIEMKFRALERDPFSPLVHLQIALSYWNQRRYDDSIAWADKALALDAKHLLAREHLAAAYWKKGDFDRHMEEAIRHAQCHGAPAELLDQLREIYSRGGRKAVVKWTIERLKPHPEGPAVQLSLLYAEDGDLDQAVLHLNRALEFRDPCLVHLAVAPQWDSLRADPRFAECVSRMGLPPLTKHAGPTLPP